MSNTVISFDIGKRNFAYCQVKCRNGECQIEKWNNVDLRGDTTEECSAACIAFLKELTKRLYDDNNTYILIERQLPQNIACMCLSHAVFAFFLGCFTNMNVSFINAHDKPLASIGAARKTEAVKAVKRYLDTTPQHSHLKAWFNSQHKKDDLADCLLQVLGNLTKFEYKHIQVPVIVLDH
jgi:hypothetical protein